MASEKASNSGNAKKSSSTKSEPPTKIRADLIDVRKKSETIDFINNVVIERGDSSFLADKMTVLYDEGEEPKKEKPDEKNKSQKDDKNLKVEEEKKDNKIAAKNAPKVEAKPSSIKKIVAQSDVKIFTDEFFASGDGGYYEPKDDTFVLEKNVKVNNGTSVATGDKFIYNLKTKKGNFVGKKDSDAVKKDDADKRVVVVIGDDLEDSKKSGKKSKNNSDEQDSKR